MLGLKASRSPLVMNNASHYLTEFELGAGRRSGIVSLASVSTRESRKLSGQCALLVSSKIRPSANKGTGLVGKVVQPAVEMGRSYPCGGDDGSHLLYRLRRSIESKPDAAGSND